MGPRRDQIEDWECRACGIKHSSDTKVVVKKQWGNCGRCGKATTRRAYIPREKTLHDETEEPEG